LKGLILSGGYGTRLRPLTYSQQKQLIPIANKPILFYSIEDVVEAGIHEIGIVVGPNKEQVIEAVESVNWDAKIQFIYQDEPRGLAHAVKISESYIKDEPFVMYLGDNILREGIVNNVNEFKESKVDASILLCEVKNPERFGVARMDENGNVVQLVEKPKEPPSSLALVGVYMFRPSIFEAIENIKPSRRNELEITDAIQWLIDNNYVVKSSIVNSWWKDTGKPEDILEANCLILDELKPYNKGVIESGVTKGRVCIEENTIIKNSSVIKGPVIIGKNCIISNAYVGPYTSIGNNCEIINTDIEDSVVMDCTKISNGGRITESLIGKNILIDKFDSPQKAKKFIIGDESRVIL
jgi:glucose-1-phosphate thymidylyltransferase